MKLRNTVSIASPGALIAKLRICCEFCFSALLPGEPARATFFRVGYIASNLSVAYTETANDMNLESTLWATITGLQTCKQMKINHYSS